MKNFLSPRLAAVLLAAAASLLAIPGPTLAASGPDIRMEPAPGHRLDDASLQRGARNFVNYCLGCHSARFMRYNRLTDLGLTEDQIRDNLILGDAKIGDVMTTAMRPADAKAWFGAPPPDLSVIARVRGADWLYNYFLGYYRDPGSATGWNNLVFPNVGMPHVLWELSGTNRLATAEFADHEAAAAAAIATKSLALVEPIPGGKYVVRTSANETPG